jgi:hypothetical protein
MTNNSNKSQKSNPSSWIIMGFIWIALALFGLLFDPEKKVIIISQFIVGSFCILVFIVSKLKKQASKK